MSSVIRVKTLGGLIQNKITSIVATSYCMCPQLLTLLLTSLKDVIIISDMIDKHSFIKYSSYNQCQKMMHEISINKPGDRVALPQDLLSELSSLSFRYKKQVPFFGGHPISMTKKDENNIFSQLNNFRQSPYLLCQKTDGVRYLLIITNDGCYFVSRQGSKSLVAYQAKCKISSKWQINDQAGKTPFENIIHILDGEMVKDIMQQKQIHRYLIFDALVIFNKNIIQCPLKERLSLIQKFSQCNKMLLQFEIQANNQPIQLIVKDFFRLTCNNYVSSSVLGSGTQPTTIQFLLNHFIKCLPHENDGIIFNHEEKPYILGPNNGYLKWKPAHLNTVDFLVIPNTNLVPRYGKRILDLYLGMQDEKLTSAEFSQNIYRLSFYNFTIVEEDEFEKLQERINKKIQDSMNEDDRQLEHGLIAECKYDPTSNDQKKIFKQLLSSTRQPDQIYIDTMKKFDQQTELQVIKKIQNMPYINYWKIFRIREDKNMPNYNTIVTKIEESIRDNIKVQTLIQKNRQLIDKTRTL